MTVILESCQNCMNIQEFVDEMHINVLYALKSFNEWLRKKLCNLTSVSSLSKSLCASLIQTESEVKRKEHWLL